MESSSILLVFCAGLQLFLGGLWLATAARCRYHGSAARPEAPLVPWGFPEKLRCAAEAGTGLLLVLGSAPGAAALLGLVLSIPRLVSGVRCMRLRTPARAAHAGPEAAGGWGVAWAGLFLAGHVLLVGAHAWGSGGAAWLGRPRGPAWEAAALALALVAGATLCLRALEFLIRARAIARGRVAGQYMGV